MSVSALDGCQLPQHRTAVVARPGWPDKGPPSIPGGGKAHGRAFVASRQPGDRFRKRRPDTALVNRARGTLHRRPTTGRRAERHSTCPSIRAMDLSPSSGPSCGCQRQEGNACAAGGNEAEDRPQRRAQAPGRRGAGHTCSSARGPRGWAVHPGSCTGAALPWGEGSGQAAPWARGPVPRTLGAWPWGIGHTHRHTGRVGARHPVPRAADRVPGSTPPHTQGTSHGATGTPRPPSAAQGPASQEADAQGRDHTCGRSST